MKRTAREAIRFGLQGGHNAKKTAPGVYQGCQLSVTFLPLSKTVALERNPSTGGADALAKQATGTDITCDVGFRARACRVSRAVRG